MSNRQSKALPLPLGAADDLVSNNADMLKVWESINHWTDYLVRDNTPAIFRSLASYILLACRYLILRLDILRAQDAKSEHPSNSLSKLQELLNVLMQAYSELKGFDVVKDLIMSGPL